MTKPRFLAALPLDPFMLSLLSVVALASFFPPQGAGIPFFAALANVVVGVLFFMHGAKLSREAIWAGILHWRLHLFIFAGTFILFPLAGTLLSPLLSPLVTKELYLGVIFLCLVPATVQSAISMTAIAKGNLPAAVCSASASTLFGILITPLLAFVFLPEAVVAQDQAFFMSFLSAIEKIAIQLFLPFLAGHLCRPLLAAWLHKNARWIARVDRSSILTIVYSAFGASVNQGLWQAMPLSSFLGLLLICVVILTVILLITTHGSRLLGFSKEDEITIVFCASKKSLSSGIPMANVLFASASVGAILLPLMLFHQIQLMVCAVLAQRYARRKTS